MTGELINWKKENEINQMLNKLSRKAGHSINST